MTDTFIKKKALPYILVLPAFVLICLFKLYPIFYSLLESIFIDGAFTFKTYVTLFQDSSFWNALWITIKLNIVMIPLQIFISFCMAMIVNSAVKGIGVFRTIFYLPVTISLTVATILWDMMLSPNNGVINSLLSVFGVPAQGFMTDKNQALWSIVAIATWKGCGYWMMFLLAGLKNIDHSIYESAKIDGSNWFKTVTKITIPLIRRVLLFVCVANTTANILLFVPMHLVTQGGPQGSTNVLMYEAYKSAFKFGNRPRSSAIVGILLILIVLICVVQFKLLNQKDERNG